MLKHRTSSLLMMSGVMASPAGIPSRMAMREGPWDSPAPATAKRGPPRISIGPTLVGTEVNVPHQKRESGD